MRTPSDRVAHAAGVASADLTKPHTFRHAFDTEALSRGVPLQDVQDALGHADPRTTRRYDRSRHNLDRSPNYLLATALVSEPFPVTEGCRSGTRRGRAR
jgi:integrase/recombinase XerD